MTSSEYYKRLRILEPKCVLPAYALSFTSHVVLSILQLLQSDVRDDIATCYGIWTWAEWTSEHKSSVQAVQILVDLQPVTHWLI